MNLQEFATDLQVDPNSEEHDSSLGSEVSSITTSTDTNSAEFRFEHGRRYHGIDSGLYNLPNDVAEMDRLELQHIITQMSLNDHLYLAPLEQPVPHVLDIGCGTGTWALEFANAHPDSKVLGTDLSPIQPKFVPPNLSFLVDDANQDWSFHERFDLIHTRAVTMGISSWDKLVAQALTFLQPGGWLELQEFHLPIDSDDGSLAESSAMYEWGQHIKGALGRIGIDSLAALKHDARMKAAGFVSVEKVSVKVPLGPWAKGQKLKKIGWMARHDLLTGLEGISTRLFLSLGWSPERVQDFLDQVKSDMMDPKIHIYLTLTITYGQKPPVSMTEV